MANHKSALKRARQNEKRRFRNRALRGTARTEIKKLIKAIEGGEAVADRLPALMSIVDGAATKGVIPRGRASRLISRISRRISAI